MKTATVRELRNNYAKVLRWVSTGEEVSVTRRGKVVAKVIPPSSPDRKVDWTESAAFKRPAWSRQLTTAERAGVLQADSQEA